MTLSKVVGDLQLYRLGKRIESHEYTWYTWITVFLICNTEDREPDPTFFLEKKHTNENQAVWCFHGGQDWWLHRNLPKTDIAKIRTKKKRSELPSIPFFRCQKLLLYSFSFSRSYFFGCLIGIPNFTIAGKSCLKTHKNHGTRCVSSRDANSRVVGDQPNHHHLVCTGYHEPPRFVRFGKRLLNGK